MGNVVVTRPNTRLLKQCKADLNKKFAGSVEEKCAIAPSKIYMCEGNLNSQLQAKTYEALMSHLV